MFTLKKAAVFMLAVIMCVLILSPGYAETSPKNAEVVPGDVLVSFRRYGTVRTSGFSAMAEKVRMNVFAAMTGAKVAKTYPALSAAGGQSFVLLHASGKSERELMNELRRNPEMLSVSLNYKLHALGSPNDAKYSQLWGIHAISADKLWNEGITGGSNVYVAVMDSGVAYNHEDIAGNFESDGYSRNFTTSDIQEYIDRYGHGSHVAGTIAAVGNNSKGIAGVNWKAKIIALKVLGDDGSGEFAWTTEAMNYLCELIDAHPDMNIAAVNLSLGGWIDISPQDMISQNNFMWVAFKALSDKNKAVICVAAGNESSEVGKASPEGTYAYPASFRNINNMIVVANAQNNSSYSSDLSSNYSKTYVDVAAPGTGILSTTPGNKYEKYTGTSMATPHVAGAAALLKSVFPEANASQIKAAIKSGANVKYAKSYTANGLLDVKKAMQVLESTTATNLPPQILTSSLVKGIVSDDYDIRFSAKGARPLNWTLLSGDLPVGLSLSQDGRLKGKPARAGGYTFTVKAANSKGSASKQFTMTVASGKPEILTGDLPDGSIQSVYDGTLSAKGVKPITWSLSSGSLPPAFKLTSSGRISGAYSKPGTWTFTVKATNKIGSTTKKITLKIAGIAPSKYADYRFFATVGKPFTKKLEVIGTGPITWSVVSRPGFIRFSLPDGLTLNSSTGVITGTPKKPAPNSDYYNDGKNGMEHTGSGLITFKAENKEGYCLIDCVMVLNDPATSSDINILTDELPLCIEGIPYSTKLQASGSSPIQWSVARETMNNCNLPNGITLKNDGTISGKYTPKDPDLHYGASPILITAKSSKGAVSKYFDFHVVEVEKKALTETLPDAVKGKSYEHYIFTANILSYKVDIISGSLPEGMLFQPVNAGNYGGCITGTPSKAGTYTFTVRIDVGEANSFLVKEYKLTVRNAPVKPAITTTSLPNGTVKIPYNFVLSSSGTASIDWTITGLPSDIGGTIYGYITGTPTKAGNYNIEVNAKNSAGSATKTLTLRIGTGTAPKVATSSLTAGMKGKLYTAQLTASGVKPMTWSLSSGKLPKGLTLSSSGKISGTPTEAGTFSIKVTVNNIDGSGTKTLLLKVNNPVKPTITTSGLKTGTAGKAYSVQLAAQGTATITYSINSGKLPKGLTLSSSGKISGTPTEAGNFTIKIKAKNLAGYSVKTFKLKINAVKPTITKGAKLSSGALKRSYSVTLSASGTKPITWTKTSGSLPPGLRLANTGKITGTPTKAGTYSFVAKASNFGGSASRTFSITITKPAISGTFANGTVGSSYTRSVTVSGGTAPYKWTKLSGTLPAGLKLKYSGAKATLSGTPTKKGTYTFTLKATDKNNAAVTKSYTVRITEATSLRSLFTNSRTAMTGKSSYQTTAVNTTLPVITVQMLSGLTGTVTGQFILPVAVYVLSDDILEAYEGRDSDMVKVKANEPVTFIIGDWGVNVSSITVYVDDKAVEGVTVSGDGVFTLPAEMVHDDFKVNVKAWHEDIELVSEELYIISE
mgnify:CR=1 FL=1